jgi:L-2-hydroxycarboxylate dehydrogenase (NAD+)
MSEGIQQETFVLDPLKARKFCTSIFVEHHVPEEEGYIVADSLVSSNLRGLDSHGITRMGIYVERLKKKLVNPTPNVKVLKEKGAIVHIDGDNGMGAVVTHKATEMGIERTKSFGVCSVPLHTLTTMEQELII